MKKLKNFFVMLYYRIYLHFYNCDGDCDDCIDKNRTMAWLCSSGKAKRKDDDIIRFIYSQEFCSKSREWLTRHDSFEKMLRKCKNAVWLIYALNHFRVDRRSIANMYFEIIDHFIPYANQENQRLLLDSRHMLNTYGFNSEQCEKHLLNINLTFLDENESEFDYLIKAAIKRTLMQWSVLPELMKISEICPYSRYDSRKINEMISANIKFYCGKELLEKVNTAFLIYKIKWISSTNTR